MRKLFIVLMAVAVASFLFVGCLPSGNVAPVITSTPSLTGVIGTEYAYTVTATDADDDPLTYAVVGPTSMVISNAGVISGWTPTVAGDFPVNVVVSDGDLSVGQNFTITVSAVEPEPEPVLTLIGITVKPKKMDLIGVGDTDEVVSVTACYEIKGYEVDIALAECLFLTSDSKVATVSDTGLVTAIKIGIADILVSYKGKTDALVVTVSAVPAPTSMEIIVDMPVFEVETKSKFTLEIVANSDVGKKVLVYFTAPDGTLELWSEEISDWVYLEGDVVIGPLHELDPGFALKDEEIIFRYKHNVLGTYMTVVEVWTVKPAVGGAADPDLFKVEPLCFKVITAVVGPPVPPEK
ncbi:hypothetical protein ES708_31751 [subsurface metagenome]